MITKISGMDMTGKSSLVRLLSEKLGWQNIHFGPPKNLEDGKKQYFDFAKDMNSKPNENIICDRLEEGEFIYAPLYRGYKANYRQEFEKEITRVHNFLFVYTKATLEKIFERKDIRGEDFVKEEHFKTILDEFEAYSKEQAYPYITIDSTNSKVEDDVETVLGAIDKVNFIWNLIREGECTGAVIENVFPRGNVNAEVMIVAQNPGGKGKGDYSTVWNGGTNSEFVLNTVKQASIYENSWFTNLVPYPTEDNKITKQQVEDTAHIIYAQVELIKPKVIIGLGNEASKYLTKNFGDTHTVIELPHPAYVKRFMSGDKENLDKYVKGFAEAKKYL